MALWSSGALGSGGGGLKPQLDTARQRLLAHGHCSGKVLETHQ
jgi:hypothetical protein